MCARPANPELRAEILKAATTIVEQCGPDCVTMREVAQTVGYSPTTLYLYFKDKHDILREVILQGFDVLADSCAQAMVGPSHVDKFRQHGRAYVVWGVLHPSLYQLMLESHLDFVWKPEDMERLGRMRVTVTQTLAEAIEAGEVRPIVDRERFLSAVRAALHGVTSLTVSRRLRVDLTDLTALELMEVATALGDDLVDHLLAPWLTLSAQE